MIPTPEEMGRLVQRVGILWMLEYMLKDSEQAGTEQALLDARAVLVNGMIVGKRKGDHGGSVEPGDVVEIISHRCIMGVGVKANPRGKVSDG